MYHELGMSVVFTLVDMLGRGHRQQADSQAEHARDDPDSLTRKSYATKGRAGKLPGYRSSGDWRSQSGRS